ncbi:hypothetical protein PUMCH_003175 [Australozyma saopauloensis]|uniref:Inhibitor I9 domain-containing protein n=1 Tax=Australozyma saopauloensis TaxID=291208 RepID=A0AAX4HD98_9ASCO|nr:hypothetical protein PUMCH_003175 [[Candida] saopauloensis]
MSDKTYLVTLKDHATDQDTNTIKLKIDELGGKVVDDLSFIKGFAVKLPESAANFVKSHNLVSTIEEDKEVKIQ